MTRELVVLRNAIASKLVEIEDLLPSAYRLTLVARHTENPKAHILVTTDGLDQVRGAMDALESQPDAKLIPGTKPVADRC